MAEVALTSLISVAAENLASFLINESASLPGVEREAEWIERELRLMQAFVEDVERSGQGEEEGVSKWAEELKEVAADAEDVIETFIIKSVKRRRRWVLSWVDQYKLGKELRRISKKMRDLSERRNIGVVVETPAETSGNVGSPNTTAAVAPAISKLSYILSHSLVTRGKVKKIVEEVRDEVKGMHNVVSNLESTEKELSEREKVWLGQAKDVYNLTELVAGDFIRRGCLRCCFNRKLMKEMKCIKTQIGDSLDRRLTYGVGDQEDVGDTIGSKSRLVPNKPLEQRIIPIIPVLVYVISVSVLPIFHSILSMKLYSVGILVSYLILLLVARRQSIVQLWVTTNKKKLIAYVFLKPLSACLIGFVFAIILFPFLLILIFAHALWSLHLIPFAFILSLVIFKTLSVWRSVGKNLESIRRHLELMRALFSDIESAQGLNERQKVWLDQLRVLAQHAESLVASHQNRRRGFFSRLEFAREIKHLLKEIGYVPERKTIYGIAIANMEGTKVSVSLGQSTQENEGEIVPSVVEHNDNSGTEEHSNAPAPAASLQVMNHAPHHEYLQVTCLKKKVKYIREEMQLMDALFKDVEEMGELDGRSKIWVNQMSGIARRTESVINDYASKLENKPIHIHLFNCWTQHVIKEEINNIRNKIQDASRRRKTYGLVQFQTRAESFQRLGRTAQPSLIVKESNIVGFDDDVEVLTAQLLKDDERRSITSITGIGGTGKTTLAKLIFDNNAVINHCHYRVWVSVPQSCTIELLLEDITKQIIGEQDRQTAEEDLTQLLKTFLANKRYLIVIDGIQTSQLWDSLKKTIPDMSTGCRLLLTSHNPSVEPGPRTFVHQVQLLDDENSWVLFRRNLKVDIPHELMKVGKEIVIKCGGLPSEILKMGDLLSQKDVTNEEWSRVLEQLNQDRKPWIETLDTIKLNLPLYLRRCLFYFVQFPAEFRIPARRLVFLWVAEGLVHHGEHEEPPEHVAERYLTELIDMNMVQIAKRKRNGKVKTCRLPSALRELWLTKANESKFLQGHNRRHVADHLDKNDICNNHIHSDTRSASASLRTYYKEVLSFLSFDTREGSKPGQDIGNFLNLCISSNCFLLLRVLDLERVYKPQLPKNIGRLSRLKYLGLRWTFLESLPSSISSLLKLQTLDLKHTYINTLTSSIWKMQLRHLFLSETYRSRFPPQPRANSLSDLQTLWGLFVDEKAPVKGGLDRLVNIRKLGLTCQSMSLQQEAMTSQLDAVADWLLRLEHLQSLRLKSRDEEGRPWNLHLKSLENHIYLTEVYLLGSLRSSSILSQFPPSLTELTLSHSRLQDDPMQILKDLPNLQSLCLLSESYIGKTLLCNSGSFPQLRVLKLWMLEQLEEWNIEQEALPCLRQLEIRSCERFKMLPDGLQHVKTLLELKLTNMPMQFEISRIKDANSDDWHKISHIPNVA